MEPVKREIELSFNPEKENNTVALAQSGNVKAFENLVSSYESYIYNLAYNMFGNVLDAQDVTQEIFIKIYKNLPKFKFNSKFKTWVYRIAVNTCLDEIKKRKDRILELVDVEVENKKESELSLHDNKTPEEILLETEMRKELMALIKALPEKYRTAIILRDLQGLTYDEIADTLNLDMNTVKVRINRARLKLKEKLMKKMKQNSPSGSLSSKEDMKGGEWNEM